MNKVDLKAPAKLCVYEDDQISKSFSFFGELVFHSIDNNKDVFVDLSEVESITAAASVILFAVVNTSQLISGEVNKVMFRFPTEDKNKSGYGLVGKTGVARALRAGSIERLEKLIESKIFFQSSSNPAQHIGKTFEFLSQQGVFDEEKLSLLSTGISEAMLNVHHHAYKDPSCEQNSLHPNRKSLVNQIGQRWWQCAWFDKKEESWVFIIFDMGIGIPTSYRNGEYVPVSERSDVLKEAFTKGYSRIHGQGRGNGSEDIKRTVESKDVFEESLFVFSGGARYYYTSSMIEPNVVSDHSLDKLEGTLVEWVLSAGRNK